jgi:hypothetical protein
MNGALSSDARYIVLYVDSRQRQADLHNTLASSKYALCTA